MAEPMSSNEIEDVLSSIRRLVAQDLKPADRARLAAVADTAQKLVLEPAQRVEDISAKFATVRRPSRRAAFPPVDAVLAGVGSDGMARDRARGADAPEYTATPVSASASVSLEQGFSLGEEPAQREAEARIALQNQEWLEIEARAAQTGAAEDAAPKPEWQVPPLQPNYDSYDEGDVYDAPQGEGFTIDPSARLFDVAPTAFAANAFDGQKLDPAPAPQWQESEPEALDDSDIAVDQDFSTDAAPTSLHGTIEPDEDWANAAEARVIAELAGEAVEEEVFAQAKEAFREPNFSATAPQAAPEVLFDEDVLRAMVQAIFREEMAGPMGERITRNIRKLVRAEVGRMLAAQELE